MNDQVVPQYTLQQDEGDQVVPHFMDTSAEVQYSDGRHEDDEDEDEDEDDEDEDEDEDDDEDDDEDENEDDDEDDDEDEDDEDNDEDSDGGAEYDSDEEDERRAIDALVQCLIDLGQMTRTASLAMDEPPAKKRLL